MSETQAQWYISIQGKQSQKPYTTEQVRAGCQSGKITADALGWREGMEEWQPLTQIAEFQDVAAAAPPPPPTPPPIAPPPPTKGARIEKVRDKLKAGAGNVKKRAQMVKLSHDLKNIQKALQQQMYALGYQATQQPPAEVDITAEMTELTQIQSQLGEKQTTLTSLQQTTGSESVAKQIKQEIGQLQKRQQELVIAIGVKVDAARPELPNIAGTYGAIDQLRTTQQQKQADLEQLQAEVGHLEFDKETLSSVGKVSRKYLPYGIGAIAVILILYFGIGRIWGLFTPAGWKDFQYYVPDDTKKLSYSNPEELRSYKIIKKMIGIELQEKMPFLNHYLDIDSDDIVKYLIVDTKKSGSLQVLKTDKDEDLEDVVKNYKQQKTDTCEDIEYVIIGYGSMCIAKTEKNTFLIASGKNGMEDALKRFSDKEKPEFDEEDFHQALTDVEDLLAYDVEVGSGEKNATSEGATVDSGLFGDTFKVLEISYYDDEDNAEDDYKQKEKEQKRMIEDLEDLIEQTESKKQKETLVNTLKIIKSYKIKLKGNKVISEGKIDMDDLEDLGDQIPFFD
jgi:hypothetical protein